MRSQIIALARAQLGGLLDELEGLHDSAELHDVLAHQVLHHAPPLVQQHLHSGKGC